jgi:NhaP-type Na+/H+ or K+/H+ antiporter
VVLVLFARQPVTTGRERRFIAWFGVRGVAALYYVTYAVEAGFLSPGEESTVVWTAGVCVLLSILVHGITGAPLSRRVDEEAPRQAQQPPRRPAGAESPYRGTG